MSRSVWWTVGGAASVAAFGLGVLASYYGLVEWDRSLFGEQLGTGERLGVATAAGGVLAAAVAAPFFFLAGRDRPVGEASTGRRGERPVRVGVVPGEADCFQERPVQQRLQEVLDRGETAVVTQVLSGMGGVGKTQLAAACARRAVDGEPGLDLLVWVTAASRSEILAGYARADAAVNDPTGGDGGLDTDVAATRFLTWLAGTKGRWMVVLDDLTTPADLAGLWPPATDYGRVLVTTRRRDAALRGSGRVLVDVELFTPDEALTYLREKLAEHPDRLAEAAELCADLGHLPLALAQAAAYLLDRGLSCAVYRRRFADRRSRLADVLPEADALPDDHRSTVAATWSLSVEHANLLHPIGLAEPLLQVASLLDPNGIPTEVLTTAPVLDYLREARGSEAGLAADAVPVSTTDVVDALRALHRLNLASVADDRPVRIHALVQRAAGDQTSPDWRTTAARAAADALVAVWPEVERDTELATSLRANAAALREAAGVLLYEPDAHTVLFRHSRSLGDAGLLTAATAADRQLLDDCLRVLGPDHPATLTARANLAFWRGEAGDPAGAATDFAELLDDRLRVLGPDHPATLTARGNLARCRGEAGDPAGAATALTELLDDCVRVLGPDHPATLTARHNLAYWRGGGRGPRRRGASLRRTPRRPPAGSQPRPPRHPRHPPRTRLLAGARESVAVPGDRSGPNAGNVSGNEAMLASGIHAAAGGPIEA
jgi:hypothetical protein